MFESHSLRGMPCIKSKHLCASNSIGQQASYVRLGALVTF